MVREIEIEKLNMTTYNPRVQLVPGMKDYERLKDSIETFGNVEPIVWKERTGNVVGGHQRLMVLHDLGYRKIPCSVVDLSEYDEKLLNLALNKIKGKWDYDKLDAILEEFETEVATLSGFGAEELAVLMANDDDLATDEDFFRFDDEEPHESYHSAGEEGAGTSTNYEPKEKSDWEKLLEDDTDDGQSDDVSDWNDGRDEIETVTGGSYVVTLIFESDDLADKWAEMEGYPGQVKRGTSTTVIRIDE